MYGQCADYDPLLAACDAVRRAADRGRRRGARRHLPRPAGRLVRPRRGVLSFNGNKIITTGGGGHARHRRRAGRRRVRLPRHPGPRARRRTTSTATVGYNYRLSNLLAAVGRGQLQHARRAGRPPARDPARYYRDCARRPARRRVHAGGAATASRTAGSRCCWSTPRRSAPTAEQRPAAPGRRRTSRRGRPGSRCTCSRCSRGLSDARRRAVCERPLRAGPVPAERVRASTDADRRPRGRGRPTSLVIVCRWTGQRWIRPGAHEPARSDPGPAGIPGAGPRGGRAAAGRDRAGVAGGRGRGAPLDGPAGALPPGAARPGRRAVRDLQVPHHAAARCRRDASWTTTRNG